MWEKEEGILKKSDSIQKLKNADVVREESLERNDYTNIELNKVKS